MTIVLVAIAVVMASSLGIASSAFGHQHGQPTGHLLGSGAFGNIELVSKLRLTDTPELVADVAVSPDGNYAFLANWGEPDCAGPEVGGQTSPDAGA